MKDVKSFNFDELADYFDRTDTQELEWEDTELKFERPEMIHVSVRIPKEDLLAIKKTAKNLGIGHTALIRMVLHRAVSNHQEAIFIPSAGREGKPGSRKPPRR